MNEKHELYCHACEQYVQFDLDISRDGNYEIICPKCGHHHYRVVEDGVITDTRWGRDASQQQVLINWGNNYTTISTGTTTTYSYYATCTSVDYFTQTAWINSTATATY